MRGKSGGYLQLGCLIGKLLNAGAKGAPFRSILDKELLTTAWKFCRLRKDSTQSITKQAMPNILCLLTKPKPFKKFKQIKSFLSLLSGVAKIPAVARSERNRGEYKIIEDSLVGLSRSGSVVGVLM